MNTSNEPADYCDHCDAEIPPGTPLWCISTTRETRSRGEATVLEAFTVWQYCEACAALLDLEKLPKPIRKAPADSAPLSTDACGELANELGSFFAAALGPPYRVRHVDDDRTPHVDIYVYAPGSVLPGWTLVTVGRCAEPVSGQHVELVMHLRPEHSEDDVAEGAETLRRTALQLGSDTPDWTFKPLRDERFATLGTRLPYPTTFLQAVYKRSPA